MISKLNLYFLFAFMMTSLAGLSWLPVISVLFWFIFLYLIIKNIRIERILIFVGSLLMILPWFHDLYLAPSNDDTINHLGFLEAILNAKNAFLGNIDRPGAELFGHSKYHFYPTGSHALTALWIYPWGLKLYKWSEIILIALWPLSLWEGSKIAFKSIPASIRFFLVAAAVTLPVFPLWPLGEGGLSRITAMVLMAPIWFYAITRTKSARQGFFWSAVLAPTFLFIHPSVIPFLALAVLFFSRAGIKGAIMGAPVGAAIFYLVIKSAQQEVTHPEFIESILNPIRQATGSPLYVWFDRLKGPIHFWLTDPYGFGKFLSPKNWLLYFGLISAIRGVLPRKLLLLFITPLIIAAISLIPLSIFDQAGLIYYHSVKRISELTPLLGFTIALFSASTIQWKKWQKFIAVSLGIASLALFHQKAAPGLAHYHELYATPMESKVGPLLKTLEQTAAHQILIIDRHEFDVLRFGFSGSAYTLKPECGEVGVPSDYCKNRRDWKAAIAQRPPKQKVWWIPPADTDAAETAKARKAGKKVVELRADAHLIEAF